jgi:hypothetical protein
LLVDLGVIQINPAIQTAVRRVGSRGAGEMPGDGGLAAECARPPAGCPFLGSKIRAVGLKQGIGAQQRPGRTELDVLPPVGLGVVRGQQRKCVQVARGKKYP